MKNRLNLFNCIENSANLNQGAQPGQYLTHAHSHIMRAVAATDSCFTLSGAHQRVKAVGLMNEKPRVLKPPLLLRRVESSPSSASSTKTLVGAVGWEPHSSSTTTCTGKVDQELYHIIIIIIYSFIVRFLTC